MKQISTELYNALAKEFGTKEGGRFIDNGDDTITDTKEKLMWERIPLDEVFTWQEAMELKNDLAGHSDWRLPTIHELFSLVDFSKDRKYYIDDVFEMGDSGYFWSSTTYPSSTSGALVVDFDLGDVDGSDKTNLGYVRLVRQI